MNLTSGLADLNCVGFDVGGKKIAVPLASDGSGRLLRSELLRHLPVGHVAGADACRFVLVRVLDGGWVARTPLHFDALLSTNSFRPGDTYTLEVEMVAASPPVPAATAAASSDPPAPPPPSAVVRVEDESTRPPPAKKVRVDSSLSQLDGGDDDTGKADDGAGKRPSGEKGWYVKEEDEASSVALAQATEQRGVRERGESGGD
jgi:hypothetical protein